VERGVDPMMGAGVAAAEPVRAPEASSPRISHEPLRYTNPTQRFGGSATNAGSARPGDSRASDTGSETGRRRIR